jgi:GNAT superfamily N-acetyltransferase
MCLEITIAQTQTELEDLFRFRYRIYVEEFGFSPLEADHEEQMLRDKLDDYAISYVLRSQGRIVGSLRTLFLADLPDPCPLIKKFQLTPAIETFGLSAICTTSRFMVAPELRHSRAIWKLMETAYQDAYQRGIRLNYGDCSPHLLPFYEHLGYRRYCSGYQDPSYGYKFPLLMLMGDLQRLETVRSPLRRLARLYADDWQIRQWFDNSYSPEPKSTTNLILSAA